MVTDSSSPETHLKLELVFIDDIARSYTTKIILHRIMSGLLQRRFAVSHNWVNILCSHCSYDRIVAVVLSCQFVSLDLKLAF